MLFYLVWSSVGIWIAVAVVRRIYRSGQDDSVIELPPFDPRPMDICPLSPEEVMGLMQFEPSPAKISPLFPDDPMDVDTGYLGITFPITTLKHHGE